MTKSTSGASEGEDYVGTKKNLGVGDENILYLACGGGYMGIYICQNLWNCVHKMSTLILDLLMDSDL